VSVCEGVSENQPSSVPGMEVRGLDSCNTVVSDSHYLSALDAVYVYSISIPAMGGSVPHTVLHL
jgi:hypothetical protein